MMSEGGAWGRRGGEPVINTWLVSVVLQETWKPTPFITVQLLLSS